MQVHKFTPEKIVRATRLSLAMLISVIYTNYVGISEGIAVTMTCAILLYDNPTVGGTINKSRLRFLGTFIGFAFAMIFIIGFTNNLIINLIGIVLGAFVAAYWFMDNKFSYIGIMICATVPMLLINNGDINGAFLRVLCISLGVIIAYILICFFYPDYARNRILVSIKNTVNELQAILLTIKESNNYIDIEKIYLLNEANIIKEFAKIVRWHNELIYETKKSPQYSISTFAIYSHLRHIYHLISVMVFHLESNTIKDYKTQVLVQNILEQSQMIIELLDKNLSSHHLPKCLIEHQKHDDLSCNTNELSIPMIITHINNEMNNIIQELIIIIEIRQHNNYR